MILLSSAHGFTPVYVTRPNSKVVMCEKNKDKKIALYCAAFITGMGLGFTKNIILDSVETFNENQRYEQTVNNINKINTNRFQDELKQYNSYSSDEQNNKVVGSKFYNKDFRF